MTQYALAGTRVLDFTWYAAGPAVTRELAVNGAEVVKIESAEAPDGTRVMGSAPSKLGRTSGLPRSYFYSLNASKRSCAIDLRNPESLEILLRLATVADIVVDNFGGDWMDRLGLGYDILRHRRDDIIVLKMPMTSRDGPKSHYRHLGRGIQAMSGLMSVTGYPDRPPDAYNLSYPDASSSPYHALCAVLAALYWRRKTGEGQLIECSQYRSTVRMLGPELLAYNAHGVRSTPHGNQSEKAAPHSVYPTRDGWCAVSVAVSESDQWSAVCDVLERPELASDPRFSDHEARLRNAAALDEEVAKATLAWNKYQLMATLQSRGVAAGAVQTAEDLLQRDPQAMHRERWLERDGLLIDNVSYRMSVSETDIRPGPEFLADTEDVLTSWLGLSSDEFAGLVVSGVVG